jgi:hypothetical protein
MPDGTRPEAGGWNRLSLEVSDLAGTVAELREAGGDFRNDIVGLRNSSRRAHSPQSRCPPSGIRFF